MKTTALCLFVATTFAFTDAFISSTASLRCVAFGNRSVRWRKQLQLKIKSSTSVDHPYSNDSFLLRRLAEPLERLCLNRKNLEDQDSKELYCWDTVYSIVKVLVVNTVVHWCRNDLRQESSFWKNKIRGPRSDDRRKTEHAYRYFKCIYQNEMASEAEKQLTLSYGHMIYSRDSCLWES